jgi:hypothetical protein
LTTNTLSINENLISRPGRIRYIQEFGNLSADAVNMYIEDNLIDKSKKNQILETVDLLEISTIDILKSIVEEVNILGGIDQRSNLNIPRANYVFDVLYMRGTGEDDIQTVLDFIKECPEGEELFKWLNTTCDVEKHPSFEDDDNAYVLATMVEGSSAYTTKLTTKFDMFYVGQETNVGEIVKKPGEMKDPRFFLTKSEWGDGECNLCMILRQRGNPSLYGNKFKEFAF